MSKRSVVGWKVWGLAIVLSVGTAGGVAAQDREADLRALVEQQSELIRQQGQKLQEQGQLLQELRGQPTVPSTAVPVAAEGATESAAPPKEPALPALDAKAVQGIIADYLKANPGAGMPPGVQAAYSPAPLTPRIGPGGFTIRSFPNPQFAPTGDDCRIPFELRIRARAQLAYIGYKTTDTYNHLTDRFATANANATRFPDFSQIEAKRINLVAEGCAFDPDLRYRINFNGFSRGILGNQLNEVIQSQPPGGFTPAGLPVSPIGGGVLVSHGVTLFEAFVAYDWRPCSSEKGCGPDCPEGTYPYSPTVTFLVGKMKPFFGLDEFLGNQNMQFVEFSMTDLMFDSDDDARLMAAGVELRALEDRFFVQALVTNGSEAFTPNLQMDKYPGFIMGLWYDLGGSWNEQRKAWDLYGDSIQDIDWSCCPVLRLGGCINLVPMDRRSLYGDAEQGRYFTMSGGPFGTRLINLLNGDGAAANPAGGPFGTHAVDKFDAYTYNCFLAGKYKGFSLYNEWWFRNLNNFRTTPNGNNDIIYQDTILPGPARNALFPKGIGLFDYGMNVAAGYFLIPKKLEVAGRWAWVRGRSGNINGNGTFRNVTVPGVAGPVHAVDGAFRNFAEANEYTIGVNYYFRRQLVKWQTDFSVYDGGNPAGGGQSIAGYLAGLDGYMLRSQLQFAF